MAYWITVHTSTSGVVGVVAVEIHVAVLELEAAAVGLWAVAWEGCGGLGLAQALKFGTKTLAFCNINAIMKPL